MSVYSTPLLIYDDGISGDESLFFTPEVSFSYNTPQCKKRKIDDDVLSSIIDGQDSVMSPVKSLLIGRKISSSKLTIPNSDGFETPKLNPNIDNTPKRCRSTPLRCISNLVTPVEFKSNMKFQDRIAKVDKENHMNNSCELTSITDVNNGSHIKKIIQSKTKNKSTFLQRLGIRRKPKERTSSKINFRKLNDSDRIMLKESIHIRNYGTTNEKSEVYQEDNVNVCEKVRGSTDGEKSLNSCSSLIENEEWKFWHFFKRCRKVIIIGKVRMSPAKKLFIRYFKKLSIPSFKSLFSRNHKPLYDVTEAGSQPTNLSDGENHCRCSIVTTLNEELANKILLKLNSLETELKEIKSMMKNGSGSVVISSMPPPPPPPLPPPLPDFLSNQPTGALKRKVDVTTPENEQVIKRPPRATELKTHFSITVDDIKSVKLRKTPAVTNTKRPSSVASSPVIGVRDGVLRSVKFKATRKGALSKKDLTHIVNEILSPSKNDGNSVSNFSSNDNKENSDFITTPIKFKSKSTKFRPMKRKDVSSESPVRKRQNSGFKSTISYDCVSDDTE